VAALQVGSLTDLSIDEQTIFILVTSGQTIHLSERISEIVACRTSSNEDQPHSYTDF
jgi:hypothetical protein